MTGRQKLSHFFSALTYINNLNYLLFQKCLCHCIDAYNTDIVMQINKNTNIDYQLIICMLTQENTSNAVKITQK